MRFMRWGGIIGRLPTNARFAEDGLACPPLLRSFRQIHNLRKPGPLVGFLETAPLPPFRHHLWIDCPSLRPANVCAPTPSEGRAQNRAPGSVNLWTKPSQPLPTIFGLLWHDAPFRLAYQATPLNQTCRATWSGLLPGQECTAKTRRRGALTATDHSWTEASQ